MRMKPLVVVAMLTTAALSGCAAVIDQSSFFPQAAGPPAATFAPPTGYAMTDAVIDLPSLGKLHAVRLDNPASDVVVIYSGGNGNFVSASTFRAAALASFAATSVGFTGMAATALSRRRRRRR